MTTSSISSPSQFRVPLQQGRFPHKGVFPHVKDVEDGSVETVYDIHHLPDGFVATFENGVFDTDDVSSLSKHIKSQYSGRKLKLVPLSELNCEVYYCDRTTGEKRCCLRDPQLTFILLVEDNDIPSGDMAKAVYFIAQALKVTKSQ